MPLGETEPDIQSQSGASSVSYEGATKRYDDSGAAVRAAAEASSMEVIVAQLR